MTITVNPDVVGDALTSNDYVVSADDPRPNVSDIPMSWAMSVNYHFWPDTPVVACVYDDEDRITVSLGGVHDDLTLYLPADQLDRLIAVLTAARRRLS
jgi:hypothetical protein